MSLLFDHVVHQVDSPKEAKEFLNRHGIYTVDGGHHTMWGTYNTLSYFGLTYIEQIGMYDRALFEKAATLPFSLHHTFKKQGERIGFSRIALRTNNIEAEAVRLRSLGLHVFGPDACSRTRPDGSEVKWKLLHFGLQDQEMDFPFFIEWADSDDVRYKQLKGNGSIEPKRTVEMESVQFRVKDMKETVELWQKILQLPEAVVGEDCLSLHLANIRLDFYEGQGMQEELTVSGPFGVTLKGFEKHETIQFQNALYYLKK